MCELKIWFVLKDRVYSDGREKSIGKCEKLSMKIEWRENKGKCEESKRGEYE